MIWLLAGVSAACAAVAAGRWLRVAQREHYLPDVTRFARLWWGIDVRNRLVFAAAVVAAAAGGLWLPAGIVGAGLAALGPLGLGVRGRTSPLTWTDRLRRLAAVTALLAAAVLVGGVAVGSGAVIAVVPLAVPLLIDLALWATARFERARGDTWVAQAAAALERVDPTVVAITGSYGKTSTKNIVAHLLGGVRSVSASPASFNNRMGLARAVNEGLAAGSEVFVAEMGTYGPGEIRELCDWIPPDVAVITALGPVHLERMGSVENIAAAKREILERAPCAVLSVDHPLLAGIAADETQHRRVVTVSAEGNEADVVVTGEGAVLVGGAEVGRFSPEHAHSINVACAVGVLVALGVDPLPLASRLASIPPVPHRRTVATSERGFHIIDDTFNSNPAGARAALERLASLGGESGRKVVVTPGMVELGDRQDEENAKFAAAAVGYGVTDLVVVNRTNRASLVAGAEAGGLTSVIVVDTREEAVDWVRETLVAGDVILYENDLPDHYP